MPIEVYATARCVLALLLPNSICVTVARRQHRRDREAGAGGEHQDRVRHALLLAVGILVRLDEIPDAGHALQSVQTDDARADSDMGAPLAV